MQNRSIKCVNATERQVQIGWAKKQPSTGSLKKRYSINMQQTGWKCEVAEMGKKTFNIS